MERLHLFWLVSLVVCVGFVYLIVDQVNETGDIIKVVKSSKCIDSDKGLDYMNYGYTTQTGVKYKDYCIGSRLTEQHCYFNQHRAKTVVCVNGCSDGKCK